MRRFLLPAGIVVADSVLLSRPAWIPLHALAGVLILLLQRRSALGGFLAALALATTTGGVSLLTMWTGYQAGYKTRASRDVTIACAAIMAGTVVQAFLHGPADITRLVSAAAAFAVLPLLAGKTVNDHERQRNAVAEAERLRIARDMHDAIGHRLSLAAIQAAALEVQAQPEREAVRRLGDQIRRSITDLHEVVSAMKTGKREDVQTLVADFQAVGVDVTLRESGERKTLPTTAFRVVQEALTNAVKHAPGQPVEVELGWQGDELRVTVTNGLAGLRERVAEAGGRIEWRIDARLPVKPAAKITRSRTGLVTAALMFGILPIIFMVGIR